LHYRCPAYDFQLGDLGQIIEDFILHPIRKIGVVFVRADILKWQDGDAFCRNFAGRMGRQMV